MWLKTVEWTWIETLNLTQRLCYRLAVRGISPPWVIWSGCVVSMCSGIKKKKKKGQEALFRFEFLKQLCWNVANGCGAQHKCPLILCAGAVCWNQGVPKSRWRRRDPLPEIGSRNGSIEWQRAPTTNQLNPPQLTLICKPSLSVYFWHFFADNIYLRAGIWDQRIVAAALGSHAVEGRVFLEADGCSSTPNIHTGRVLSAARGSAVCFPDISITGLMFAGFCVWLSCSVV